MRFIKPINLNEKSFIMDVRLPEERAVEELGLPHVNQDLETLNPLEFIKENHIEKNDFMFFGRESFAGGGAV